MLLTWAMNTCGNADAAENRVTSFTVRGGQFRVNDQPVFLLGCSYYGALGGSTETWTADLDDMQRAKVNWIRVWVTWAAFGNDVSAIDSDGKPREPYFETLMTLIDECDRRGILVDVTLSRGNGSTGPARLQTQEAHRRAVEVLVTKLKHLRNWYLDLGNERNIRDARFVRFEDLKVLRARARELDADRLVTASHGGDIDADELRKYVIDVQVDFVCPHRPRDRNSPGQTEQICRDLRQQMQAFDRVVPVHFQEPFRRGYPGFIPEADDYLTDLKAAIAGGAGGWCFHNGATRGTPDEQPRRSFDLGEKRLFDQIDTVERDALSRLHEVVPKTRPTR
jgi:hypothetical protein